jgi:GNAT superfamily N-acetyltransferase
MTDWRIERFGRQHSRTGFNCGRPPLDDFIRKLVSQYEKRNLGRTYVGLAQNGTKVSGYYTIASGHIPFVNLPETAAKKLPRHPVPAILIARLAVDQAAQGQGLGEGLLIDALRRCVRLADGLGVHAVEVDAIDPQARGFYAKYGFVPMLDAGLRLFLPIVTLQDVLPPP